jgi:alanine dehydrogenase
MGAEVTLLDTDLDKLRMSFWRYDNRVRTDRLLQAVRA